MPWQYQIIAICVYSMALPYLFCTLVDPDPKTSIICEFGSCSFFYNEKSKQYYSKPKQRYVENDWLPWLRSRLTLCISNWKHKLVKHDGICKCPPRTCAGWIELPWSDYGLGKGNESEFRNTRKESRLYFLVKFKLWLLTI